MAKEIKVGILGLGTVGGGVYKILQANKECLAHKIGADVTISKILVRDLTKYEDLIKDNSLLTLDPKEVIADPEIDIVIEVIGGTTLAKDYVGQALDNGKSVLTANKDLIAQYGRELFQKAEAKGVDLLFEASVGGGIPILRPLKQCLAGNNIEEVMGIINGTTNYMLTKMTQEGSDFGDVLKEAQKKGYAEADPTADVEGLDAARKLAILASIAFNTRVTFNDVFVEGITKITAQDIDYAKELGCVIKLLGIAKGNGQVEVRVHPTMIPKDHPLASVNDVFNAIFVKGDAVGETMFYGRGAGEFPTASAIMGDLIDAARNIVAENRGRIACTCWDNKPFKDMAEVESQFYIRLKVLDEPGVLASIAQVFGQETVSLHSVIQKQNLGSKANLVFLTHRTQEGNIQRALETIKAMDTVDSISNVIRVEGEIN